MRCAACAGLTGRAAAALNPTRSPARRHFAEIAQSVEHTPEKRGVRSSTLRLGKFSTARNVSGGFFRAETASCHACGTMVCHNCSMSRKPEKHCRACGTAKVPLRSGTLRCPLCRRLRSREYYHTSKKRRAAMRRNHFQRKYGTSIEALEQLLSEQGSRCAICRTPWAECAGTRSRYDVLFIQHLHVDHDHETGAIRGLLCMNCNMAIGLFEDEPSRVVNAILYLQRTRWS